MWSEHAGWKCTADISYHVFQETSLIKTVLNYLLQLKRNLEVIDKLRHVKHYSLVKMRTDRFKKSFIPYCTVLQLISDILVFIMQLKSA